MEDVLKEGGEARKLAISLQHVQYSDQLVEQLFKHSEQMEQLYGCIQKLVGAKDPKESKLDKAISMALDKMKWFEKSKEAAKGLLSGLKRKVKKSKGPKSKAAKKQEEKE